VASISIESLEQPEKLAKFCNLNNNLTTNVKDLEGADPIQDGLRMELATPCQEIQKMEKELQIKKCCSAWLVRQLNMDKSEQDSTE